ncbi:MAG: DUF2142 domain-containing protein [Chloroflexota bacterium]|nr:DUF2142 domain-containing protein [Chloroflexota bacterium]
MIDQHSRWVFALLLLLTAVRGLLYAAVIPPWQSPDETGHFEYVWLITHLGRLPGQEDASSAFERELLGSLYEWRYGEFIGRPLPEQVPERMADLPANIFARSCRTVLLERFSLAYLWSALFLLPFHHQDLVFQLYAARLSSVLLNVAIVWLAIRTFSELMPARPDLIPLMTAVVVFLPQHTFINSMVGEGPLAELMACLVLWCWARLFRRGFRIREAAGIMLGTLVGIWSKTTAVFLIPLDAGLALWWLMRRSRRNWTRRQTVYVCIGIVILGVGTWLWSRSPLGVRTLQSLRQVLSFPELVWVDRRGITFGEGLLLTYDSFWANFGWMAVPVSERWYGAIALISLMSCWGWWAGKREETPPWAVGMMSGGILMALLIFIWYGLLNQLYYWIQGRYLFPIIIPFAFLLVGGWIRFVSPKRSKIAIMSLLGFLIVFDTWCFAGYIIPYFYS